MEKPERERGWFAEIVLTYGPAIVAVLFIRAFIFEPFQIPSGSMIPTLLIGDHVIVTKYSYGVWMHFAFPNLHGVRSIELLDTADPERGDIIVFRYPGDETTNFIKRVVAIPGDTIRVQDNQIVLNGELLPREPQGGYEYMDDRCVPRVARHGLENLVGVTHDVLVDDRPGLLANRPEFTVPPGQVFVMGDNRDNSLDSRSWGTVRFDQIKGKAHFVWLSWDGCSAKWRVRTDRMGRSVYDLVGAP